MAELSVVIPAFNEAQRLPPYLQAIRTYLDTAFSAPCEVIVVDDGSDDGTAEIAESLAQQWQSLRLVRHDVNRGKGAAVRTGILASQGELVLFADADGATPIEEEQRLRAAIRNGADIAIGSRLASAADPSITRRRTLHRAVIGKLFAMATRLLFRLPVRDTQCGFKMFRSEAARRVFRLSQENGFMFDIEVLAIAQRLGYRIEEVPIAWADQPGSRVVLRKHWRQMVGDLRRLHRTIHTRDLQSDSALSRENES